MPKPSEAPAEPSVAPAAPLWTIDQVAAYLQVPKWTVYRWSSRGEGPPSFKIGRHLRFDPAQVRAWVVGRHCP